MHYELTYFLTALTHNEMAHYCLVENEENIGDKKSLPSKNVKGVPFSFSVPWSMVAISFSVHLIGKMHRKIVLET